MRNFFAIMGIILLFSCSEKKMFSYKLWYKAPAKEWTEALPVGNGHLGAMVYGKTDSEIIQFNEETLWAGQPHDYANPGAYQYLAEIRKLLWEGKQDEAQKLANEHFMSQPFGQFCYMPFGNIALNFPGHETAAEYQRDLNLNNAIATVSYSVDGVKFEREIFSSAPDQAIIIHLKSSKKGKLSFSGGLNSPHINSSVTVENNMVNLSGKANNYHKHDYLGREYPESLITFESRLTVLENDGSLSTTDSTVVIDGATEVTLALSAATSFVNYQDISGNPSALNENYIAGLTGKSYSDLKKSHREDYQSYYNRLNIDLGTSDLASRPTDERLNSFYEDNDPSMVALLYQYGRYLLISSSRPGSQPANLQGIWNDQMQPPWDSKYTININAEMNYWPSELTNLSDCAQPLMKMVEELAETGKSIAKEHYNLEGWVAHHNTDIWRGAAPINNSNHGIWPTGGAWLSQHMWWHYQFTGDKKFLMEKAYPVLKEASRFFTGYLVPDPQHSEWLISGPSNSPEQGGLVMGPAMDHQIIRELFSNTIEAAKILGVDDDFARFLAEKKDSIAPNQIGKHGQLQEWLDDVDDPTNQHRHCSHLWGLHPGSEIHPSTTPEFAEACKVSLAYRGDGGTGWSRAWKINFWARLLEGDHSFLLLKNLMVPAGHNPVDYTNKGGLYPNLFDAHPPFQIDGNFGATSGVTEMLLQSHLKDQNGNFILDILPALPDVMSSGEINGVCARGGFELNMKWQDGKLLHLEILSKLGNACTVRYNGNLIPLATEAGKKYTVKI